MDLDGNFYLLKGYPSVREAVLLPPFQDVSYLLSHEVGSVSVRECGDLLLPDHLKGSPGNRRCLG